MPCGTLTDTPRRVYATRHGLATVWFYHISWCFGYCSFPIDGPAAREGLCIAGQMVFQPYNPLPPLS